MPVKVYVRLLRGQRDFLPRACQTFCLKDIQTKTVRIELLFQIAQIISQG